MCYPRLEALYSMVEPQINSLPPIRNVLFKYSDEKRWSSPQKLRLTSDDHPELDLGRYVYPSLIFKAACPANPLLSVLTAPNS